MSGTCVDQFTTVSISMFNFFLLLYPISDPAYATPTMPFATQFLLTHCGSPLLLFLCNTDAVVQSSDLHDSLACSSAQHVIFTCHWYWFSLPVRDYLSLPSPLSYSTSQICPCTLLFASVLQLERKSTGHIIQSSNSFRT